MQELDSRAQSILAALRADVQSGATQLALNTLNALLSYLDEVGPDVEILSRLLAELRTARPSMIVIGNALALRQAAVDGLGPVLLADWLVEGEIRAGRLIDLFPDHDCTATEFDTAAWALYPSRAYLPRKVRVTIDFLRDRIGR